MIPALLQARRASRAVLGLGAAASLALVVHLALDAPASSAAPTEQHTPTATATAATTASPPRPAKRSSTRHTRTFSPVPRVSTPSPAQPTQAQTHSS